VLRALGIPDVVDALVEIVAAAQTGIALVG